MQKKIWLSALDTSKEQAQEVIAQLRQYGLAADGHFFDADPEKMTWIAPRKQLLDKETAVWVILAGSKSLSKEDTRYGLAMLAHTVQAERGLAFPIFILQDGEQPVAQESLPTALAAAQVLPLAKASYGAKLVAAAHKPVQQSSPPYRLDVYGIQNIGQWFEIGPREGVWKGAIFGISEGGITMHAVGPAGQLPEKSVLNYPQEGLRITLGEKEFTAWAVQNEIDPNSSYYVKVEGAPQQIMFCPFASEDETEAFVINLR